MSDTQRIEERARDALRILVGHANHTYPDEVVDCLEELLVELNRVTAQADCGGTNCGKCQQCLTVNFHFTQEALRAAEHHAGELTEALRVIRDYLSAGRIAEAVDATDAALASAGSEEGDG